LIFDLNLNKHTKTQHVNCHNATKSVFATCHFFVYFFFDS
jgi:hypothetical protein